MSTLLARITRRGALAAGSALGSGRRSAAACVTHGSDLFVFRAASSGNLVLAATFLPTGAFPARPGHPGFEVRIHTGWNPGATSWTVSGPRPLQAGAVTEQRDGRIFVGEVRGGPAWAGTRRHAVVLETSPDPARAGESLSVWAEVLAGDGSRFRIGNPFVAAVLARDPLLSGTHHATSPAQDAVLLTGPLAEHVAIMAATRASVAHPDAYGRRLAARLLPNVISYCPKLPVGFTFAAQNGRHPADDTAAVVETVLTGAVARGKPATPFRLAETFPYFAPAA